MTSEQLLDNTFFSYFFCLDDYLLVMFAFAILFVLIISIANFFLGVDRRKP